MVTYRQPANSNKGTPVQQGTDSIEKALSLKSITGSSDAPHDRLDPPAIAKTSNEKILDRIVHGGTSSPSIDLTRESRQVSTEKVILRIASGERPITSAQTTEQAVSERMLAKKQSESTTTSAGTPFANSDSIDLRTKSDPLRVANQKPEILESASSGNGFSDEPAGTGELAGDERHSRKARLAKERARSKKFAQQQRMRDLIILQLLSRKYTDALTDRLLKMLIEFGISETEYRQIIAQIGQQAALSLAEEVLHQPVAMTVDGERTIGGGESSAPAQLAEPAKIPEVKRTGRNRAELYRKLKDRDRNGTPSQRRKPEREML